jgi:hypothetical protein
MQQLGPILKVRTSGSRGNQEESDPLCRPRLDLILIAAIHLERTRFQQFLEHSTSSASPKASVYKWEQPRPLLLKWNIRLIWLWDDGPTKTGILEILKKAKKSVTDKVNCSTRYPPVFSVCMISYQQWDGTNGNTNLHRTKRGLPCRGWESQYRQQLTSTGQGPQVYI